MAKLVGKGAEAELREATWEGKASVEKIRVKKAYRHPELDLRLRKRRTSREARMLRAAGQLQANSVQLYCEVDGKQTLVLEKIDGTLLSRELESPKADWKKAEEWMGQAGTCLAKLHSAGIVHGDFTTTNLMVDKAGKVRVIDFGLGEFSRGVEEQAIDILLFERSLASTGRQAELFKRFWQAYCAVDKQAALVMARAKEILSRGRYQQKAQ